MGPNMSQCINWPMWVDRVRFPFFLRDWQGLPKMHASHSHPVCLRVRRSARETPGMWPSLIRDHIRSHDG